MSRSVGGAFLLAASLAGLPSAARGEDFKATPTVASITLDGQLNESAWQKAPAWGSFSAPSLLTNIGAVPRTQFKVLVGANAIYLGVVCDEPSMKDLQATPSVFNSIGLFNNDCIEIFLDPSGRQSNYYQFALSAANSQFSQYYIEGGNTTGGYYAPAWKSAVHKGDNSWTAEIEIPLSALYYTRSSDFSSTWGLNVARERLAVSPRQLTSWSKLKSGFLEPTLFNRVGDMPIKEAKYDVRLGTVSAQLTPQGKTFEASLQFRTTAGSASSDQLILSRDGKTWVQGKVAVADGEGTIALKNVPISQPGKTTCLATLRDATGQIVHEQHVVFNAEYRPLAIRLDQPFYANCIFPGQSINEITGRITSSLPADQLAGAQLTVSLTPSAKSAAKERTVTVKNVSAETPFSIEAANLPVGDYQILCRLSKDGRTLAETTAPLRKLAKPARGSYAYIDRNLNFVVNGKPIFVRGWYGGSQYAVSQVLRDRLGDKPDSRYVNAWESSVDMEAERLDPAEAGQRVTEDVKPSDKVFAGMLKGIEEARNDPNIWWYYLSDEPECRGLSPVYLKYQYDFIKQHDPYHPVMIISREPDKFIHCADILNPHPYLNPTVDSSGKRSIDSMKRIRDEMRLVLSSADGRIPAWCTPQAFSYEFQSRESRHPTFLEYRCMIYTALVNGAKGFTPFMYANHFETPDLRYGCNFVYQTLAGLNEFLIAPEKPMPLKVSGGDDGVDVWAKTVGGKTLLIAVNLLNRPNQAEISSDGLKSLSTLVGYRENTTASVDQGRLSLQFRPYEVHLLSSEKLDAGLQTIDAFESELAAKNAALKKPGNILYGRGRTIEWDASSVWGGLGGSLSGIMHSLCDGMTDCYGWRAAQPGDAWIGMIFPDFVPQFTTLRAYGANISKLELQIWKRGEWVNAGAVIWNKGQLFAEIDLPKSVRTVKARLNLTAASAGVTSELYEVEMYDH